MIGEFHGAWSVAPAGGRVALGISAPGSGGRIGVRILRLSPPSVAVSVQTGVASEALAWLRERILVAALQSGIVLVDPATGTILRRWTGWSSLDANSARTRTRFVLLHRRGPMQRLAVVDATGELRSVPVDGPGRWPLLVVDPAHERAYVLAGGRRLLEVDLRRMRVERRTLSSPAGGRDLGQSAVWLGHGRLALSGGGLRIIDVSTGSVRTLERAATGATVARGRLLASGPRGVRAYTLDGRSLFRALGGRRVWNLGARGNLAYVGGPSSTRVMDVRSGRVVRRIRRALQFDGVFADRCWRQSDA